MFKYARLFIFLSILLAYLFQHKQKFFRMMKEIKERSQEVKPCQDWCETPGYLVTFNELESKHCKDKCWKFSAIPPIVNYLCELGCKPIDYFMEGKCIKSEFCLYYKEVNDLNVTEAVKERWLKAITRKVVKTVTGG